MQALAGASAANVGKPPLFAILSGRDERSVAVRPESCFLRRSDARVRMKALLPYGMPMEPVLAASHWIVRKFCRA